MADFRATGISGSLTKLVGGGDYLIAGTGVTLSTGSDGSITVAASGQADSAASYVVMGLTSSLSNERVLTAGTGLTLTDGGANGNATLAINNSIVATVSGTNFTGNFGFGALNVTGTILQQPTAINTVTGATLTVRAQSATGTSTTGGKLILSGGDGVSAGGNVEIYGGSATGASSPSAKIILSGSLIETTGSYLGCSELRTNNSIIRIYEAGAVGTVNINGSANLVASSVMTIRGPTFLDIIGPTIYFDISTSVINYRSTETQARTDTFNATGAASIQYVSTVTSVAYNQADASSGTGAATTISAQSNTGGTGGKLILSGGNGTTTGGNIEIYGGHASGAGGSEGQIILSGSQVAMRSNLLGFFGKTPQSQSLTYSVIGLTGSDRTLDVTSDSVQDIRSFLATLACDLMSVGILKGGS